MTSRDNIREGYFPVMSGSRPGELGPSKVDCDGAARGHASPGRLLLSVGVSMMRASDQSSIPNSPGRCPSDTCNPRSVRSPPAQPQQLQPQETSEQQREQELQLQQQQLREATTFHGAAIGQTGTSTRQKLTAWIRVLAIPCRSMYATDSASMLNKALRLIQAAERNLREKQAEPSR